VAGRSESQHICASSWWVIATGIIGTGPAAMKLVPPSDSGMAP
jgi:hypothetical protein